MLAALRFLWRCGAGGRLRPWRSPYLRWRVETYSGLHAETITAAQWLGFVWRERGALIRFLFWCGAMSGYRRHSQRALQSGEAGPAETA